MRMMTMSRRHVIIGDRWGYTRRKRKDGLRKSDMPRDVNTTEDKIQTSISLVFIRIAKKYTRYRAWRKFIGGGREGVGKT
jgi:hypothetical protein